MVHLVAFLHVKCGPSVVWHWVILSNLLGVGLALPAGPTLPCSQVTPPITQKPSLLNTSQSPRKFIESLKWA